MVEVIWSEPALEDLARIAAFIELDKPEAARRLVSRVVAKVEALADFPKAGGKPAELRGTPYRQLVIPPLRVFYRIADKNVYIVHVMRGERRFRLDEVESG